MVICVIASFAVYSNPELRQQIFDLQQKGMQKSVTEGKMTQEQFDRASEQMENSGPVMFIIIGSLIQIVPLTAVFFLGALAAWLIVKLGLKSPASYSKLMEIYGLSLWIGVLGAIVTIIMMSLMNSMFATPSGSLLLGDSFDQLNKGHKLLGYLNVFTLWETGVSGIGIAKISGKSTGTGMIVAFGVWALFILVATFLF